MIAMQLREPADPNGTVSRVGTDTRGPVRPGAEPRAPGLGAAQRRADGSAGVRALLGYRALLSGGVAQRMANAPVQLGKKKVARRKAQQAARETLVAREREEETRRQARLGRRAARAERVRQWDEEIAPRLGGKGGGGGKTGANLAAEGPTARSLYIQGQDLAMWDLMSKGERAAVRGRHPGMREGQTPDLVLDPGGADERIGDIFTSNAPEHRRDELAEAVRSNQLGDPRERRALMSVYDSILSNAHDKMNAYGGGTTAVVNLTQVPWADPETIRRGLEERYDGGENVPGTVIGTVNDERAGLSRTIPIWPPTGRRKPARHFGVWQKERQAARARQDAGNDPFEDDGESGNLGFSMFD